MDNNKTNCDKCSVVVSSYDGNADVWQPFFTLFFRYWPDCPFPIYLVSNYKKYDDSRVKTISVGEDKGWATNMKTALRQIPTGHLICMLDDLFLKKTTNTGYIKSLVDYVQNNPIAYVGLVPFLDLDESYTDKFNLGRVRKSADQVSFRASLWDKKIFDSLLTPGEDFWEMELAWSKRSRDIGALFLSVKEPVLYYDVRSALIRRKWMYDAVQLCKKEGIRIDTNKRPIDYEWKWKVILDDLRKGLIAKKLKQVPLLGKLVSWFYWRLSFLRVNKIFSNGK